MGCVPSSASDKEEGVDSFKSFSPKKAPTAAAGSVCLEGGSCSSSNPHGYSGHYSSSQLSSNTPLPRPRGSDGGAQIGSRLPRGGSGASGLLPPLTLYSSRSSTGLQGGGLSACVSPRELYALMSEQGVVSKTISRQLSELSRYSIVTSEDGSSVVIGNSAENLEEVQLGKQIGLGGFGKVYQAVYEGQQVAVKVVTSCDPLDYGAPLTSFHQWQRQRKEQSTELEAILMSAVVHPNIVRTLKVLVARGPDQQLQGQFMLPVVADGDAQEEPQATSFCAHIIMELCDQGTLLNALVLGRRFHEAVTPLLNSLVRWDAWAALETLKEVTRALLELRHHHIVHGDLKPLNIMLSSSQKDRRGFVAKLTDFGLSRVMRPGQQVINTRSFGTVTHMPPELLASGSVTASQDVYALGVLMWECFCADIVYKEMSEPEIILAVATKQMRPTFPDDVHTEYQRLAQACWSQTPEARPELAKVYEQLCLLQLDICPAGADSHPPLVAPPLSAARHRRRSLPEFSHGAGAAATSAGARSRGSSMAGSACRRQASTSPSGGSSAAERQTGGSSRTRCSFGRSSAGSLCTDGQRPLGRPGPPRAGASEITEQLTPQQRHQQALAALAELAARTPASPARVPPVSRHRVPPTALSTVVDLSGVRKIVSTVSMDSTGRRIKGGVAAASAWAHSNHSAQLPAAAGGGGGSTSSPGVGRRCRGPSNMRKVTLAKELWPNTHRST